MSQNPIREAIKVIEKELEEIMVEVRKKQQAINVLHESIGEKPVYDLEEDHKAKLIGRSQFYGKSFAAAAREFLEIQGIGNSCTPEEIYEGLKEGAFEFPWKSDHLRMVSISLSKNTSVFHKLPNGTVGLLSWYPEVQKKKADAEEQNNGDKTEPKDEGGFFKIEDLKSNDESTDRGPTESINGASD